MNADYSMFNRRHFLRHMAGLSAMALPGMQFVQNLRAAAPILKKENKSLIVLWMSGGPPSIDIWDLKPGTQNGGDFKAIPTTASGIEISEHMPKTAQQMKNLSLIRSLVSNEGSHERGRVLMHTGRQPSAIITYPSIGSIVSYYSSEVSRATKDLALPGFISVGRPADGPGFLGMNFAPFTVQNPGQPPQNIKPPDSLGSDEQRIRRRQRMFYSVEDAFLDEKRGEGGKSHSDIYGKAFKLVASGGGKVFNISNEKKSLLDEYGTSGFGKGCLLARKLVEAGVTCVEVDLGGWDLHANCQPTLKTQRLPQLDQGMGALVKDLVDRGMWKNTVVLWLGEFGRTPKINQNAGRDHWARCWSVALGGGAIKGGIAYGSTSADGTSVKDSPVSVGDLFATVYKGLGLDPNYQIRDNLGRPLGIAPEKSNAVKDLV